MRFMLRGSMKTRILPRLLRLGVLTLLGPTVLSGCGLLRLDPSGSSGDAPALAPLPDPAGGWVVAFPARTPAQEKKADAGPCDDEMTMRLRAEFMTGGAALLGDNVGGWNDTATGFVPARGIPYPLGASFDDRTLSTVGGTQYESLYQIELKDDGNWWVGHNGNWLGYYPSALFGDGKLAKQACAAQWYEEVSADLKQLGVSWTWTNMSSGHFAEEGFSKASYLRDMVYLAADGSGTWSFPPMDPDVTKDVTPYNPACYSKTSLQTGASPWDLFFYADGPGSDNPLCQ